MFHLLVSGGEWPQARASIDLDRVINVRECTDAALVEQFKPGGLLNTDRIAAVPALFVSEIGRSGSQQARVGEIIRTREEGAEVIIDYRFDSDIPPIPNSTLKKLATDLSIQDYRPRWELRHSHWAIKDIDLFKVLFRNQAPPRLSPKVFKLDDLEGVDDKLISVMMPFDKQFDEVYATIQRATQSINLRCERADEIWKNAAVIQDVVSLINRSRVVICDCTRRNANVFYETGIADTLGREVILIAQSEDDIPFDLQHLRYVTYLDNPDGREQLAKRLKDRIKTLLAERVS